MSYVMSGFRIAINGQYVDGNGKKSDGIHIHKINVLHLVKEAEKNEQK